MCELLNQYQQLSKLKASMNHPHTVIGPSEQRAVLCTRLLQGTPCRAGDACDASSLIRMVRCCGGAGASMGHPLRTRTSAPLRLTDNEFTIKAEIAQPEDHLHSLASRGQVAIGTTNGEPCSEASLVRHPQADAVTLAWCSPPPSGCLTNAGE